MFADNTPISALTSMVWDEWLGQMAKGYARLHERKAAAILHGIKSGVNVDFEGERGIDRVCQNLKSATTGEAEQQVNAIIEADCKAGKKSGPHARKPFTTMSVSPIGAVPKKNGKLRVIHHLSFPFGGDSINASTVDIKIELGRLDHAADAIRALGPGCLLIKLDVEAAYKQVPVRREDWPLLGFKWRGHWFYERTLPFVLKSSCRLWELYATALHHFFEHDLGIKCVVHYIDDFLFVLKPDMELAEADLKRALELCIRLGIPIAGDKTEGPCTLLTFLGIELDTVNMTASLSQAKLSELQTLLRRWGRATSASVNELQSLTGVLNWACSVVRPGRAFMRRIIDHTKEVCRAQAAAGQGRQGHRNIRAAIPESVQQDIRWWQQFAPEFNGVSLLYEQHWTESPKLELYTDACQKGFGALWKHRYIYGPWSRSVLSQAQRRTTLSMPFLELHAIVLAVATWGRHWATHKIVLHTDCMPALHAINSRSSRDPAMAALVRQLMTFAARWNFDLRAKHVPGVLNVAADALSRDDLQVFRDYMQSRADGPEAVQGAPQVSQLQHDPTPPLPPLSSM